MSGLFSVDLLIYAAIAVFLILRLSKVLGMRIGHEQKFEDKIIKTPFQKKPESDKSNPIIANDSDSTSSNEQVTIQPLESSNSQISHSSDPRLAASLAEVAIHDKDFEAFEFVASATKAFELVFEAFVKGDRATLKMLLKPLVYDGFISALDDREKKGHDWRDVIVAIKSSRITDAEIVGKDVFITVEIESEQINSIYDDQGQLIEGSPDVSDIITEQWTFTRILKSRDPAWLVSATQNAG